MSTALAHRACRLAVLGALTGRYMIKIILVAIAIWLVISVLKGYRKNLQASATEKPADNNAIKSESMVQCAHCGVHLPTSDSFLVNGQYYCCEAHINATNAHSPD
jgi:uncharacterized protein